MRREDCTRVGGSQEFRHLLALFLWALFFSALSGCGFGPGRDAPAGDTSKSVNAMSLTAVSPSTGPQTGGTTVTLTGTGFVNGMTVTFDTTDAASVTVQNSTTATAVSPSHATGPVAIAISSTGASASMASAFTYTAAFGVTGISPSSGPTAGGVTAIISGSGFQAGATVTFGGVPATIVNTAATQLTVTTPPGSVGTVTVTVVNPGGTSQSLVNAYTYTNILTVSAVSPASGPSSGGTSVTISGVAFQAGAMVFFGGAGATSVSVVNATTIQATTPAHFIGSVDVMVSQGGKSATLTGGYTFVGTLSILSVAPSTGGAGSLVIFNGSGFQPGVTVSFGGAPSGQVNFINSSQISAIAPAHANGVVNVVVVNGDGQVVTLTNAFTYAPLSVSSIQPNSGVLTGNDMVTISGTTFQAGATVTFGGVPALSVSVVSSTEITAVTPPMGAPGLVGVVVQNPGGATASGTFTYLPPVTVTGVAPGSGTASGGSSVIVTGTNFQAGSTVLFGGFAASSVVFNSSTQLTVTTPPHPAGTVDVQVSTPNGLEGTLTNGYIFTPAVFVGSVTPASGPIAGGTTVTVSGGSFVSGAKVLFGGVQSPSVTFISAGQLQAVTPAGAGTVSVAVVNPDLSSSTLASAFTYVPGPTLSSVSPNTGFATGGTGVTVSGTNFAPGATVVFGGFPGLVTFVSSTQLSVLTPAEPAGTVNVQVTNPDGQTSTLAGAFTFIVQKGGGNNPPSVSNIVPATGSTAGGDSVVINGDFFVSGATVTFGGVQSPAVAFNSSTQLVAVTPPASAGPVNVIVTNPDTQTSVPVTFTYLGLSITQVSPNTVSTAGGTQVTITGTLFQNPCAVTFGGVPATSVLFVNSSQLTATAPPHAVGPVDVDVTCGGKTAILASGVTYQPPPTITALSRNVGSTNGGTIFNITGTGFETNLTVQFGGVNAPSAVVVNSNTIRVTTPAHAAGTVSVQVNNPDGSVGVLPASFDYEPAATTFYFNTSFEGGTFGGLTGGHFSGSGLNTVISSDVANSGTHSVKCEVDFGQASGISRLQYIWGTPHPGEPPNPALTNPNGLYQRWFIYFSSGSVAAISTGGALTQMKLVLNRYDICCGTTPYAWFMNGFGTPFGGGAATTRFMAQEDSGIDHGLGNFSTNIFFQDNVWYEIELKYVRDGVNHVGQATMWINGVLQGQTPFLPGYGNDTPTAQQSGWYGAVYVQNPLGTVILYMDDAAAADGFIEPPFYP